MNASREKNGVGMTTFATASELAFTVALFILSFYIFSRNFVSNIIVGLLGAIIPAAGSLGILFAALFFLVLADFFYKTRRGRRPLGTEISWILFLPSIMGYAMMDPLKILSLPFTLSQLQPQVPYMLVVITAVLLASGDVYFSNTESIQMLRMRFAARGALRSDLDTAIRKNHIFVCCLVIATFFITLAGCAAVNYIAGPLAGLGAALPFQLILLPVLIVSITAAILFLYLKSSLAKPALGDVGDPVKKEGEGSS